MYSVATSVDYIMHAMSSEKKVRKYIPELLHTYIFGDCMDGSREWSKWHVCIWET